VHDVDPGNTEAARSWNGPDGDLWAELAPRFDAAVARYDHRLFDAAAIAPTDRVLDVGCGNGYTSRAAARVASAGRVVGIDLSSQMLAIARLRAAEDRLTNATFVQGDAQVYPFEVAAIDVAISRAGTMFFADPVAAFANIGQALRPGGRLVQLTWQSPLDNEWIATFRQIAAAGRRLPSPPGSAPGPYSLSDPQRLRQVLAHAGYIDVTCDDVREPMYFGRDVDDASTFVGRLMSGLLADLDERAQYDAAAALRHNVAAHCDSTGVWYGSAAWLVNARRPLQA
jgi:SAM-dependent methyltransferase